jgi:hypothetical protein
LWFLPWRRGAGSDISILNLEGSILCWLTILLGWMM